MIEKGIKLKCIVVFLKEYLTLILIIPAFVGGLWQCIELMNISPQFIRFFSISQIVPDGLVILMFLLYGTLTMVVVYITSMFLLQIIENKEAKQEEIERDKNSIFDYFILLLFFGACIYWILSIEIVNRPIGQQLLNRYLIFGFALIFNYYLFIVARFKSIKQKKQLFYRLFYFLQFPLIFVMVFSFCSQFHNNFIMTGKLDNIENIHSILEKKHPKGLWKILYFNDKYVFVKIIEKNKTDEKEVEYTKKIHIMEIKNLFND